MAKKDKFSKDFINGNEPVNTYKILSEEGKEYSEYGSPRRLTPENINDMSNHEILGRLCRIFDV